MALGQGSLGVEPLGGKAAASVTAYTGTATKTLTISVTAAGVVGRRGTVTKTLTISATAAGRLGLFGAVTKALTLSALAAGTVTAGYAGDASPTLTISVTAVGNYGATGGATKALTVSVTAAGVVGRTGAASRTLTISTAAVGRLGLLGAATQALTVTTVAVGSSTLPGTATKDLTLTATAAGVVFTGPGALADLTISVDADGVVLVPAETQLIFGIGGRRREGSATVSWEAAEVPPPWDVAQAIRRIAAHVIDSFTVTGPRQNDVQVEFRTESAKQPKERMLVNGHDVTYLRGAPCPSPDWQLIEPGLYGPGSWSLPQIKGGNDHLGTGDLHMFRSDYMPTFKHQIKVDGSWVTVYRGFIGSENSSGPDYSVTLIGELSGLAGMDYKAVRVGGTRRVTDLANLVVTVIRKLGLDSHAPAAGTGIQVLDSGGTTPWDWLTQTLASSTSLGGVQWTVMPDANGTYRLQRKNTDTIHYTVFLDDAHVKGDLVRDYTDEDNLIYGDATDKDGLRITGAVIPGLVGPSATPNYPMAGGASMPPGTTDAETLTGGGVTALIWRLFLLTYLDEKHATYDAEVTRAVRRAQLASDLDEHGDTVLGTVDPRTWQRLWDGDKTGYSMRTAHINPLARDTRTQKYRTNASGQRVGLNKRFDRRVKKRARYVSFGLVNGQGQAVDWAQGELDDGSPDYAGTIDLPMGAVIAGRVEAGDPFDPSMLVDARLVKPNENLYIANFRVDEDGHGTVAHIVGSQLQGGVPQLTVDTRRRDTQEVWSVLDRIRETKQKLGRIWRRENLSSGQTQDQAMWDRFGGVIDDDHHFPGGQWSIFPVRAGREGQVSRLLIELTNDNPEFAIAVFGRNITEKRLTQLVGNPLTEDGRRNWRRKSETLTEDHIMVYSAGTDQAPLGYHPTSKAEAPADFPGKSFAEVRTGRFRDDAGFPFRTYGEPVLTYAVFPDRDCTLSAGRLFRVQISDQV